MSALHAAVGELLKHGTIDEECPYVKNVAALFLAEDQPTGVRVVAGDPRSPGDGTARGFVVVPPCAVQGGAPEPTEVELQATELDVRIVLLSDGSLLAFRGDANYRVLPRIGNREIPDSFRAHELADEYEDRAEALRLAIRELT